jgi:predicted amino acid racemase
VAVTLTLDVAAIRQNVSFVRARLAGQGIAVVGVTKAVDSEPDIGHAMLAGGAVAIADSRVPGLARLAAHGIGPRMLIRPPQWDELDAAARLADWILLSDVATARELAARARGRRLGVLVLVDIGDRRDGVLPEEAAAVARDLAGMPGLAVGGLAVNFACLSGLQPELRLFEAADALVAEIAPWCASEPALSLGGTYCLPHLLDAFWPRHACTIRLGAGLYFGHYTLPAVAPVPGMARADPVLTATVIECRRKPAAPAGVAGVDSFGLTPDVRLPDGPAYHALLALGRRESEPRCLHPFLRGSYVAGMSSDHTVLVSPVQLRAGDTVDFALDYEGLVRAMTSAYVQRVFLEEDHSLATHRADRARASHAAGPAPSGARRLGQTPSDAIVPLRQAGVAG